MVVQANAGGGIELSADAENMVPMGTMGAMGRPALFQAHGGQHRQAPVSGSTGAPPPSLVSATLKTLDHGVRIGLRLAYGSPVVCAHITLVFPRHVRFLL
jgi:hypothetical protein